jgi:hypothetical protein
VLSLRAESSTSPEADGDFSVLSSGVSLVDEMSKEREWEDEGRMWSEVALGFGGGGMARLDGLARPPMASASADGNCGDRVEEISIEGGADGAGPEESSIAVFKSSPGEDVMARGQR